MKRVIVIGLDGMEPSVVEPMIEAGELPHLARMRERGGYGRLRTTTPAQTPVAWSTFATGTNPGGHGIFDFIRRDPQTYLPLLAFNRYEQKNRFLPPKAINNRRGTTIWARLTAAGIPSTVIRCPCTYPPDELEGRLLAGVGVPDLRGGLGTPTYLTTDERVEAQESEQLVRLTWKQPGVAQGHLVGPRHPRGNGDLQLDFTLEISPNGCATFISSGEPGRVALEEGRWSDWLRVKFKVGFLVGVRGMLRLLPVDLSTERVALYASPVNFLPDAPLFPISSPPAYAGELEQRLGSYHTLGMAEDDTGLKNERIDEAAFLEQCNDVLHERRAMMHHELERHDRGLFYCLFDTPDRLAHMVWRFREPDHPANRDRPPLDLARALEEHYVRCDEIVGEALEYADDQTLAIVLSDHGMTSFQRQIHLNSWLYQNGLLALKDGHAPGSTAGTYLRGVDWSRTRAYALGLGGVYLNLRGREAEGIVSPDEAPALRKRIADGLTGLRDPKSGEVAIRSVATREELYRGPYVEEAPDLHVNCAVGYRVSWGTPLGGVPEGLFEDNTKKWSGDHTIDPDLVPGVLFMNRPFRAEGAGLEDLAPTILEALGIGSAPAMEGNTLLS